MGMTSSRGRFKDRLAPREPRLWRPSPSVWALPVRVWAGASCGSDSDWLPLCLAVSLELGDVSLVSVHCEGLQPTPDGSSRGQLLAQLQELLHRWVLWAAVKSRWVIVGECAPVPS